MERPSGVTILAILSFVGAALLLLGACMMFFLGAAGIAAAAGGRGMGGPLAALGAFAGVAFLVLAAIYIVNGIGLWKLLGWGRMLTIVLVVIGVIFGLLGLVRAVPIMHVGLIVWQLIVLAIDVWILTYMFKPHVKQAFGQ
ncbi:MAG: hypothetical protein WA876_13770 [Candidatus Acidiferrales bacterium]